MHGAKPGASKPALLVCYLCGQQFGSSSLPIHQPQCYHKKLTEWKNRDKATRGPKPRNPADADLNLPSKITARNAEEIDEFNNRQFGDFQQQLAQCNNCGRKFFPDRLQVHLRSCKPDASGKGSKPVNGATFEPKRTTDAHSPSRDKGFKPQLLVCYLCGQQFGTQSLPIHVPQCYKKRIIQWQNGDPATRGPKPRDPATVDLTVPSSLQNGVDIDTFNQQNFEQYNSNLSPCPNCARTFNPSALQVHLRSCKIDASGGGSKPIKGKELSPLQATTAVPKEKSPPQRPAALVCYLCGQQYGSASLAIHQTQCYKKHLMQWENADPEVRGPRPRDPTTVEAPTSLASAEEFNNQAFTQFQQNLSQCPNCGRKFLPDRLQVHMRSCNTEASGGGSKPINRPQVVQPLDSIEGDSPGSQHSSESSTESGQRRSSAKFGRRSDNIPSPDVSSRYADPDAPILRDRSRMLTVSRQGSSQASSPLVTTMSTTFGSATSDVDMNETAPGDNATSHAEDGEEIEDEEPVHVNLAPCSNCGRRFAEQRLEQHEEVCRRMKKRKPYNTFKHRAQGTGIEEVSISKATVEAAATTKTNWREKHEALKAAMKSSRDVTLCLARGGKLSDLPPPPPAENPDYVTCPHCSRRFNQNAAERHIPACARTVNKPKAPPKRAAATGSPPPAPKPTAPPKPTAKTASAARTSERPSGMPQASPKAAPASATAPSPSTLRARFCSECGYKYDDQAANFCQECGIRRD